MSSEENSFTNAFKKFLKTENLEVKYREKLLIESWGSIMGKPIAARTNKLFIKNRVLFIELSSAPLKQELVNNKTRVKEMIDEDFGGLVDDVRFL